jgi:FkbM family methyltransferase
MYVDDSAYVNRVFTRKATVSVDARLSGENSKKLLELLDREPLVLIDVGARGGAFTFASLRPYTRMFGFEPEAEECARLNADPHLSEGHQEVRFIPNALSAKAGPMTLYVCQNPNNTSRLPPNMSVLRQFTFGGIDPTEHFKVIGSFECEAITLDDFVNNENLANVDFVKLDTQGTELEIIDGGQEIFREKVTVASIEVEFKEMYSGQPLFRDVDRRMHELGFVLLDLEPIYGWPAQIEGATANRGELMWGEAVYGLDVVGRPELLQTSDTGQVARYMLMLESLGFMGHAAAVASALDDSREDRDFLVALAGAIVTRNASTPSRRMSRDWMESAAHRVTRTVYSVMPGPLKAVYRKSPLRRFYTSLWRKYRRSRGLWY